MGPSPARWAESGPGILNNSNREKLCRILAYFAFYVRHLLQFVEVDYLPRGIGQRFPRKKAWGDWYGEFLQTFWYGFEDRWRFGGVVRRELGNTEFDLNLLEAGKLRHLRLPGLL